MTDKVAGFQPVEYTLAQKRLAKLGRAASRKSYPFATRIRWLIYAFVFSLLLTVTVFQESFDAFIGRIAFRAGLSPDTVFLFFSFSILGVMIAALFYLRSRMKREIRARVDFDSTIRLSDADKGLYFATGQIEYLVKWNGIHELLREPDGIVVVHGSLFFLIPDDAFASDGDQREFIGHVLARLTPEARERSKAVIEHAGKI